jgi:ZIP family zinc transporter
MVACRISLINYTRNIVITNLPSIVNVFLLSFVASLGTGLGGLLAVIRRPGRRTYGFLMGLTSGVMICLSFLDLVNEAWDLAGPWVATIGFALGATFMFLLDTMAPHIRFGETEVHHPALKTSSQTSDLHCDNQERKLRHHKNRRRWNSPNVDHKLVRTGLLLAIGIALHNLPEGIAVGAGYMHNPRFGLFIALAIMLHNIPEGIATALPLCKAGVCRSDALRVAFLSGLAEPIGAVLSSLFLEQFRQLVPGALAFAGGVMVFITLDELIPAAREHGHQHYVAGGIIVGSIFVFILSGVLGV